MIEGFHKPATIEEALELASRLGERAAFLGGGVELNSSEGTRDPEQLITLASLGLDEVVVSDDLVSLGACCTYQQLIDCDRVPEPVRVAAAEIANRSIRNQATLGGAIASDQLVGDLLPALVALGASLDVYGSVGPARVAVEDWLAERDGLITTVAIPRPVRPVAFRAFARSNSERSFLVVAVSLDVADGRIVRPIVAVGGVAATTVRLTGLEESLEGGVLPSEADIEAKVASLVDPPADYRASSEVKRQILGVLVARAVHAASGGKGAVQ